MIFAMRWRLMRPPRKVLHDIVLAPRRPARPAHPVEVRDEGVGEVGTHHHFADTGLGLGVRDVEAGSAAVVEADVADTQVGELAVAHAAVAQDAHNERPASVWAPTTDIRRACQLIVAFVRPSASAIASWLMPRVSISATLCAVSPAADGGFTRPAAGSCAAAAA